MKKNKPKYAARRFSKPIETVLQISRKTIFWSKIQR